LDSGTAAGAAACGACTYGLYVDEFGPSRFADRQTRSFILDFEFVHGRLIEQFDQFFDFTELEHYSHSLA
jgi:hypothetical protein